MRLYIRDSGIYQVKDNGDIFTMFGGKGLSTIDFDDLPEDIKDKEIKEEI